MRSRRRSESETLSGLVVDCSCHHSTGGGDWHGSYLRATRQSGQLWWQRRDGGLREIRWRISANKASHVPRKPPPSARSVRCRKQGLVNRFSELAHRSAGAVVMQIVGINHLQQRDGRPCRERVQHQQYGKETCSPPKSEPPFAYHACRKIRFGSREFCGQTATKRSTAKCTCHANCPSRNASCSASQQRSLSHFCSTAFARLRRLRDRLHGDSAGESPT
jgi:hypothetical protein